MKVLVRLHAVADHSQLDQWYNRVTRCMHFAELQGGKAGSSITCETESYVAQKYDREREIFKKERKQL